MKAAQWILLVAFFLFFLSKGLLPAFSHIGTDFANYYTASWLAIHDRAETSRLYDQPWFATKASELGEPRGGIFQPFPPPTALLMLPLAGFSMAVAKDLWTVLNVLMLAALIVLLRQFGQRDLISTALMLFGTGWAVVNNVYLGQVYLLMLLCLALSFHFLSRGHELLAGSLAGIFIPIKYFPICVVVLFLLEKRWRAVWASLAMTVVVTVVSVVVLGGMPMPNSLRLSSQRIWTDRWQIRLPFRTSRGIAFFVPCSSMINSITQVRSSIGLTVSLL